ncbi:hypothetical protein [Cupriavidus sp. EM10]|uniref:hypothetical protein n=1 Tax=Cupriavidus sp. EM10 TaxID=2839983 RepID=UPI00351D5923
MPAPRPGYVWAPGYWMWDDHYRKHAWKRGHWETARPGYVYEQPRWVRASNGWVMQPERWNRGPDYDRYYGPDRGHRGRHDHDDDYRGGPPRGITARRAMQRRASARRQAPERGWPRPMP